MTPAEMLPHLQRWSDVITGIEEALAPLRLVTDMAPESQLNKAIYAAIGLANEWCAQRIGSYPEALEWYWLENQMGERGHEAGTATTMRPIRTLQDYAELLAEEAVASETES